MIERACVNGHGVPHEQPGGQRPLKRHADEVATVSFFPADLWDHVRAEAEKLHLPKQGHRTPAVGGAQLLLDCENGPVCRKQSRTLTKASQSISARGRGGLMWRSDGALADGNLQ